MKPLDCKGEFNKCKVDIVDKGKGKDKTLKELLKKIKKMSKKQGG